MTVTRANARNFLVNVVLPFIDGEMRNAITGYPGTVRGIEAVLSAVPAGLSQTEFADALNALMTRRAGQIGIAGELAALLDFAVAVYLTAINSPVVSNGRFDDRDAALIALRESLVSHGEYIASIGDTLASDPAGGDGIILRRLAVDADGQAIEGGQRETVTFEVTQTALSGAGQRGVVGVLYGGTGIIDALDRAGGTNRTNDVRIEAVNELFRGGVWNGGFVLGSGATPGADIPNNQTMLGAPWEQVRTGTPTVRVSDTNVYGTLLTSIAISGSGHALELRQPLLMPTRRETTDPTAPVDSMVVVHWDGTWEGSIDLRWGTRTQTFTHAAFTSGAGIYYLHPAANEDLFPANFGGGTPLFSVKVSTSNTGVLKLLYADTQRMVRRQGHYYSLWSRTDDPTDGVKKTWADARAWRSPAQRAVLLAYEQSAEAYLPTSGTTLLAAPAAAAALEARYGGAALPPSGTVALGATSTAPQTFVVSFRNAGTYPAALGPHVEGATTNGSLTGGDLDGAALPLAADLDDWRDVEFEVTPAGAGAYSVEVTVPDGTGGSFTFTVTGTAS